MTQDDHRHDDLHARLLHLEERIKLLEAGAVTRVRGGPGPKYFESGDIHPELDDQTITP